MKLKQLLKETKVWERKFGESLPTLEDTTKAYKLKLEQEFKAKSKETGRTVVYKSKDSMDKAIKGGKAEPLDKKTGGKPEKVKGADLFTKDKTPVKVGDKKPKVNTKELRKDFKEKTKEYDDAQQMHTALDDDLSDYDDYNNISDKKLRDSISYDLGKLQDKLYTVSDTDAKFKDLEEVYVELETLKKQVNDILDRQTKPKSEPKKVPPRKGPEGMQGTKDTLAKSLQTGLNPYQHSGLVIQVLDFVGDYPELTDRIEKLDPPTSIGKSDAQYQKELDAFRETENELRNDIIKALSGKDVEVGTKIKDGKIKSSGSQQFADDVRKIKGEYELNGVKIKDGKMFDADGKEMDDDDIDDFYYQDAYDEKGVNVGIDIKKISEVYLKKSLDLLNEAQVWERKFGEPLPTFSSVMEKHSGKKDEPEEPYDLSDFDPREDIDEQGVLSRRAGINVFGDKKLELMAKGLRSSARELERVAKKKDERNFDNVLLNITTTIGVIRSYLNKPKRSM
jgi:hypothetical protein